MISTLLEIREKNIERNNRFLESIGLTQPTQLPNHDILNDEVTIDKVKSELKQTTDYISFSSQLLFRERESTVAFHHHSSVTQIIITNLLFFLSFRLILVIEIP